MMKFNSQDRQFFVGVAARFIALPRLVERPQARFIARLRTEGPSRFWLVTFINPAPTANSML
jgi:hypothetical protein